MRVDSDSRVVRDFYHKYTVDEHTLLTIRNLERLATRAVKGRERFGALLAEEHAFDGIQAAG